MISLFSLFLFFSLKLSEIVNVLFCTLMTLKAPDLMLIHLLTIACRLTIMEHIHNLGRWETEKEDEGRTDGGQTGHVLDCRKNVEGSFRSWRRRRRRCKNQDLSNSSQFWGLPFPFACWNAGKDFCVGARARPLDFFLESKPVFAKNGDVPYTAQLQRS